MKLIENLNFRLIKCEVLPLIRNFKIQESCANSNNFSSFKKKVPIYSNIRVILPLFKTEMFKSNI